MSVAAFEPTAQAVWSRVVERAREELPSSSFNMWFSRVRPTGLSSGVLSLLAPSDFVRDWLARNYLDLIQAAAQQAVGEPLRIELGAAPATPEASPMDAGAPLAPSDASPGPADDPLAADERSTPNPPGNPLPAGGSAGPGYHGAVRTMAPSPPPRDASRANDGPAYERPGGSSAGLGSPAASPFPDRYTFESFVPGSSNRFAHAAALAVAEAPPSKAYNPLFIYGGVGLGKTHLLFAIATHMWALSPRTRVRYVTSESFMTEFIKAVRERRGYAFQRQYRDVDVLLLDDVQFLARAEETQTEFFHTFNHLHQHERQIVIASDRPPQELGGIEERLRSRFRSGLVVDVQPPDLETRIAILQLKVLRDRVEVPDDVLHFIASKFENNIRELEGALLRVAAFASLSRQSPDLALAERALEDLITER